MNEKIMQAKSRRISVDHHQHNIGADGIENFYWPVLHKTVNAFGYDFMDRCADLLRNYPDANRALAYKMAMKYFIAEAAGLMQGDLVHEKSLKDNIALSVPQDWKVWPFVFSGKAPPETPLFSKLCLRAQKSWVLSKFFQPVRTFKKLMKIKPKAGGVAIDGMKVAPITASILAHGIVATQRNELMIQHAKTSHENVYYCSALRWFQTVSEAEIEESIKNSDPFLEKKLMSIAQDLFEKSGVTMKGYVHSYLSSYLTRLAAILRIHYDRLSQRSDIPRTLWTGTGGSIWDLLLRTAVLEKGGDVTGHDHAGGLPFVDLPLVGFIELWACSRFMVYNQTQAENMRQHAQHWPLLDLKCPDIEYLKDRSALRSSIFIRDKFREPQPEIKKIVVLSTVYDRDRGRSFAFYPDLVYVDWQARLISHLKGWGYDVLIKPHPESPTLPPKVFEEKLGSITLNGFFEDVLNEADMIIIDYAYTTTFTTAFKSNIPIVVIDFDKLEWLEDARALMEKRCVVVDGCFDSQNRAQIDWNDLQKGILAASPKCNDTAFIERYYL